MSLRLETPIVDLFQYDVAGMGKPTVRKLAVAVAAYAGKPDAADATVDDLLSYFPKRYEDRSNLIKIDGLQDGTEASLELFVRVSGGFRVGKNRSRKAPPLYIFEITASDAERILKPVVVWWFVSGKQAFHAINFYKERFSRGVRFVAYGRWEWDARRSTFALRLNKPDELELLPSVEDFEAFGLLKEASNDEAEAVESESSESLDDSNQFPMIHTARRVPVYRKLGQFQPKRVRELMYAVLQLLDDSAVKEALPVDLVKRQKLISHPHALSEIHFPPEDSSLAEYEIARSNAHRRLIFEEFFWLSFALQYQRGQRAKEPKGAKIRISDEIRGRIEEVVPFDLTGAQKKVVGQIFADMTSDSPMNRLVQGDVGSGKTIVALMAMLAAVENGYQTAMMAPTEILAEQHYKNFKGLLSETPFDVELLTGSMKAVEKRRVQEKIADGEVEIVLGTHAVIQDAVEFGRLGLVVVDEQHRFGVLQRAELRKRGFNPDVLVMTATPIPRSLAMTVYGDLDVSIIDELPPGRTPIKTVVVGEDKRLGVYRGIERELAQGRQVYVVYPLVDESEKLDLKAATKMYEELNTKIFPQFTVGLLHGRMKAAEKEEVMGDFRSGKTNILVSTTVVEVGVDVPNASLMIIEHAERFGLSQLHQLRGRVGRGAEQSFCVLLTDDKKTEVAKERLGIMEETTDGFRIAEKDLEIRGQGEILGTRQSGVQTFKIANIVRDLEILEMAKTEAESYLFKTVETNETQRLISIIKSQAKYKLAAIG